MAQITAGCQVKDKEIFIGLVENGTMIAELKLTVDQAEFLMKSLPRFISDCKTGRESIREEIEEYVRKHG